jgi:hypothetical protein
MLTDLLLVLLSEEELRIKCGFLILLFSFNYGPILCFNTALQRNEDQTFLFSLNLATSSLSGPLYASCIKKRMNERADASIKQHHQAIRTCRPAIAKTHALPGVYEQIAKWFVEKSIF